jgi:hypothetical protein
LQISNSSSRGGVQIKQLIGRRETDQKAVPEKEADHTDVLYVGETDHSRSGMEIQISMLFCRKKTDQKAVLMQSGRSYGCSREERKIRK